MRDRHRIGFLAIGSTAAGAWLGWISATSSPTELWFLDVGQGDCAVFRHAGVTVLIDAGPATPERDTASRRILEDLRHMGVSSIDLALLSHPDADHIGGLRGIARQMPIRRVGVMEHFDGNPDLSFWLRSAGFERDQIMWLRPGTKMAVGAFSIALDSARFAAGDSDNYGSMFVRIESGTAAADLTGDADAVAESVVLGRRSWQAQVVKAGHHGSKTATTDAWLSASQPEVVVISCGRDNSYGHPSKEVLDRVAAHHAEAARTDQEGDLRFIVENGKFKWAR